MQCTECGVQAASLRSVFANFDNYKSGYIKKVCFPCYVKIKERNKRDLERVKAALETLDGVYLPSVRRAVEPFEEFKRYLERDPSDVPRVREIQFLPH